MRVSGYVGRYGDVNAYAYPDALRMCPNFPSLPPPPSLPPSFLPSFSVASLFREDYEECPNFLRHKTKLFSPEFLKRQGVQYQTVVQLPGEFVIPMPGAYHFGFNHGYNIAEATNFATARWFDIGRRCSACTCDKGNVQITSENIALMETLWLRQRNISYESPFTNSVRRMRCMCKNNDKYNADTDRWESRGGQLPGKRSGYSSSTSGGGGGGGGGGTRNTQDRWIFQCAGCRLYCHWDCVFGNDDDDSLDEKGTMQGSADSDDDDEQEQEEELEEYLCHMCHELEFPHGANMVIRPVCFDANGTVVDVLPEGGGMGAHMAHRHGVGKPKDRQKHSGGSSSSNGIGPSLSLNKPQAKPKTTGSGSRTTATATHGSAIASLSAKASSSTKSSSQSQIDMLVTWSSGRAGQVYMIKEFNSEGGLYARIQQVNLSKAGEFISLKGQLSKNIMVSQLDPWPTVSNSISDSGSTSTSASTSNASNSPTIQTSKRRKLTAEDRSAILSTEPDLSTFRSSKIF